MTTEKKAQVLQLDPPQELIFQGPFNDVITANLVLTNPSNKTVLFKVKTTAPKQYCVRPNSGILEPGKHQTIAVMLQPSMDLPSIDKSKHKFMVQSMFSPPDFVADNLDQMWKAAPKTELMDSKLRCSFVEDQSSPQTDNPEPEQQQQPPTSTTEVVVEDVTTSGTSNVTAVKEDLFISVSDNMVSLPQQQTKQEEEINKPSAAMAQPTAGSTPAQNIPKDTEIQHAQMQSKLRSMQDKLDRVMAENTELKGETSKLRQRVKPTQTATSTPTSFPSSPSPAPSSPLNIVAILLILVALVLGYLVGRWL